MSPEEQKQKQETYEVKGQEPSLLAKLVSAGNGQAGNGQATSNIPQTSKSQESLPANPSPSSSIGSTSTQTGNLFTKLFPKKSETPGMEQKPSTGTSTPTEVSVDNLLPPKPLFESPLVASEKREKELRNRKLSRRVFVGSLVLALLAYLFFSTQFDPSFTLFSNIFGPNVSSRLHRSSEELKNIQTKINEFRFRSIELHISRVNQIADNFLTQFDISQSSTARATERKAALEKVTTLRKDLKDSLAKIKSQLSLPLVFPAKTLEQKSSEELEREYEQALTDTLASKKNTLQGDEIRLIDNLLRLVENRRLRGFLKSRNVEDMSDKDLVDLITFLRNEGTDDLSLIAKVKQERIPWAEVISDIEHITRKVDKVYGQGLFQKIGGVSYQSYQFEAQTGKIVITGNTRTDDSRTFTVIANLIDAFEKSDKFKNAEMRSFSKSKDDKGFFSTINLELMLQKGLDPRDEPAK